MKNDRENCLQPSVTQCGSYVKVPYKSFATKGKILGGRRQSYEALIVKWYKKYYIYWTADFWNQVSHDHGSCEHNRSNCVEKLWKSQDFNEVWTRDLATPVRRSNQLSYEATDVGSWSFVSCNEPVKNGCKVIYEILHILNCGFLKSSKPWS